MKIYEALDVVAEKYPPGLTDFYSKMNPDPWMAAHEKLEAASLLYGIEEKKISPHAREFVSECERLISAYRLFSPKNKKANFKDNLQMATTRALNIPGACDLCASDNELKVKSVNGSALTLCVECSKKRH